jgi:hypothetical protein
LAALGALTICSNTVVGSEVRQALRRHLFLFIGVLSLSLFFLVALFDRAGKIGIAQALAGPMRVLIVPIYLVWMLIAMAQVAFAGPHGLPQPLAMIVWGFSMVAGLAPYALADYILNRRRRAGSRK